MAEQADIIRLLKVEALGKKQEEVAG